MILAYEDWGLLIAIIVVVVLAVFGIIAIMRGRV